MNSSEDPGHTIPWTPPAAPGTDLARRLLAAAHAGAPGLDALRDFDLGAPLGHGGMGSVFLLASRVGEPHVALKVMANRYITEAAARLQFHREVEVARRLTHPNIVRLLSSGCHDDIDFHLTEYCDAGTLAQHCQSRGGRLPVGEAVAIVRQILDGIEYAHSAPVTTMIPGRQVEAVGLVHRDLKPSNVFLHGAGGALVAKIGDFGLAKAFDLAGLSGYSATGARAGTPAFMPRQQVLSYKYAMPEVDVWAAAACLYYTLTGTTPRDFTSGLDRWGIVLTERPVPIRDREGGGALTLPLAELIDAAVSDDPSIRFKTVTEFRSALDRVLP